MNFYTVGIEGMPRLLLEIEAPMEAGAGCGSRRLF